MQRGRRSSDALVLVPSIPGVAGPQRPDPPDALTSEQKKEWNIIVERMPPGWFTVENWPILRQLCQHISTSKFVAAELATLEGGY